jgi:uncharacterized protein YjbJ (UPF0337 family)
VQRESVDTKHARSIARPARYVRRRTDRATCCAHSHQSARSISDFDSASAQHIHSLEKVVNKKQVNGRIKEAQGIATEVMGKVLGNKHWEAKGKVQRAAGKMEAGYGDLKADVKEDC